MTSRQARRERREQERKAKKAAYKAGLQVLASPATPPVSLDDEFSPEFLARARAMRERIERRVAIAKQNATRLREPQNSAVPPQQELPNPPECGFVSHKPEMAPESIGFVSQNPPSAPRSRAQINRANAAHSSGPRSPHGKLASSRNSLKHGLASGRLIIPGEDPAAFESLLEALLAEHQPANTTEAILIHEMAQSFWLTQRALRLQNECFTENGFEDERTEPSAPSAPVVRVQEKRLALFLRYHTTHERAFHKGLNALIRIQKERRQAETREPNGFVSQHNYPPGQTAPSVRHLALSHSEPAAISPPSSSIIPEKPFGLSECLTSR